MPFWRHPHFPFWLLSAFSAAALLLFASVATSPQDSAFFVSFFDVGQGDAVLVRSPGGVDLLVDSGKGRKILEKLGETLPLWDHRIEFVILTHPDQDHIGGFPDVLERYEVGAILLTGVKRDDLSSYKKILSLAEEKKIPLIFVRQGSEVFVGEGARLTVLAPAEDWRGVETSDTNRTSVVSRLNIGAVDFLLTGDIEAREERALIPALRSMGPLEILKVAHHGSRSSSDEEFLRAVSPKLAVISVGNPNPYGHPHAEVLSRLNELGALTLRTAEEGDIVFSTDGRNLFRHQARFPALASLFPFRQKEFVLEGK